MLTRDHHSRPGPIASMLLPVATLLAAVTLLPSTDISKETLSPMPTGVDIEIKKATEEINISPLKIEIPERKQEQLPSKPEMKEKQPKEQKRPRSKEHTLEYRFQESRSETAIA